jgi:ABC-2 type transport system ATP-binding protein
MTVAVKISNLSKAFYPAGQGLDRSFFGPRTAVQALDNVSLSLAEGEILFLLGANGAGKTTLIKILSSLIEPDAGRVEIFGLPLHSGHRNIKSQIGVSLSDERSFYWRLTGRQNLEFFGALYELPQDVIHSRIQKLEQELELEGLGRRYESYSAGYRQRLMLARSLMVNARLLLLDEPTRSLDPVSKMNFHRLIRRIAADQHKTFIIASHDLAETETLADRVVILDRGKLKTDFCGSREEIFVQLQSRSPLPASESPLNPEIKV